MSEFGKFKKEAKAISEYNSAKRDIDSMIDYFVKLRDEYINEAKSALQSNDEAGYYTYVALIKNAVFRIKQFQDQKRVLIIADNLRRSQSVSNSVIKKINHFMKEVDRSSKVRFLDNSQKTFNKAIIRSQFYSLKLRDVLAENQTTFQASVNVLSDIQDEEIKKLLVDEIKKDEKNADTLLDKMEKEFKVQVKETPTVELEVEAPKTIQPKVTVSSVTQPVENKTVEEPKATELPKEAKVYELPSIDLLDDYPESDEIDAGNEKDIKELIPILIRKLDAFGIHTEAAGYIVGPTYSRIELNVLSNVQVKKIASIQQDLEMALKRKIRPLLPIKGKNLIGIEVENARRNIVGLKETMLQKEPSDNVDFIVGEDIEGKIISMNFKELPHMLVGGSPGAGKTVFLHSIITSLLLRYSPDEVKLALIDFKRVEFNYYRDLPHLLSNRLIDEYSDAYELLEELAKEMNRRYDLFYNAKVSDIDEYNKIATVRLPQIILVIDEYADMCGSEYKDRIQNVFIRLAQKARASGIHLIVATQRPSVSVISGVLKANLPTRVSFLVPTHVDSCNILDVSGAQSLTGKGDMLFGRIGSIERIQAPYISVDEIKRVVDFIKKQ